MELIQDKNCVILSEEKWLAETFPNFSCLPLSETFDVKTPFCMDLEAEKRAQAMECENVKTRNKRKRNHIEVENSLDDEIKYLKSKLQEVKEELQTYFKGLPSANDVRENNKELRVKVKEMMWRLEGRDLPSNGCNSNPDCEEKEGLLLPARSSFHTMDISRLPSLLLGRYEVILLDPPWHNRHVKRAGGYAMMDTAALASLPVPALLAKRWCLVGLWCTNSPSHRAAAATMMSRWGVAVKATWYWVKLTRHGQQVCEFSHSKQPHEVTN